jgi:hypothetical protein
MGHQGQPKRGAILLCRMAGAALLPIILNACAAPPLAISVAAHALPPDPILQAVATSTRLPQTVITPSGTVIVTVTSDYISAEGNECRGYTLAAGGQPALHLACHDGAAWRNIPPLAPADNESGLP